MSFDAFFSTWIKPFENIVGKEDNSVTSIYSFSKNVVYPMKDKLDVSVTFYLSSANALNLDKANIFTSCRGLTHSHTMTPFDAPGKQAF